MEIQTAFYALKPYDNLLYVESYNSWDENVVRDFACHGKQIALQNYKEKAWAILHDAREWQLGTPAIESMIANLLNTPLTNTITHHAYVAGKSEIQKWQVNKIFQNITTHEARVFENIDDAEKWLLSYGYTKLPKS